VALALADEVPEDPRRLNDESWSVVCAAGAGAAAYELALLQAETACRLIPGEGNYLNTLAAAQYRVGRYQDALSTLSRSQLVNAVIHGEPVLEDLAFRALAEYRLGHTAEARSALTRLRTAGKKPGAAEDEDAQALLREAETIELDLVFPANPFAR
jgi:hypothetical protein